MDDPFALLGLPRTFDLSSADIRRAWRSRAAVTHPDHMAAGAAIDDGESARASARLNDAHLTLLDAEKRADALVVLLGGPTGAEEKGLSPEFLMEIMETRQELESAVDGRDEAALARLRAWADEQREAYIARVGERFAQMGANTDVETLREIRLLLNEWRYIERMIEQSGDA